MTENYNIMNRNAASLVDYQVPVNIQKEIFIPKYSKSLCASYMLLYNNRKINYLPAKFDLNDNDNKENIYKL